MLSSVAKFLGSVGFGNTLLLLILALSGVNLYTNGRILESSRTQESPPVSTTYTDIYGMEHTVNSPMQASASENIRVHKEYLADAFCELTPANPPAWWHPEDCHR